eukprot:7736187-Pyramimonas_sp.AAC.1
MAPTCPSTPIGPMSHTRPTFFLLVKPLPVSLILPPSTSLLLLLSLRASPPGERASPAAPSGGFAVGHLRPSRGPHGALVIRLPGRIRRTLRHH